jgi:hypothetical protein
MKIDYPVALEPKMQAAVEELAGMIAAQYPSAQFRVSHHPEEPTTILLDTIVDVDDTEAVLDVVFERMEQLRLDESVPILVLPLRTPERVAKLLADMQLRQQVPAPAVLP